MDYLTNDNVNDNNIIEDNAENNNESELEYDEILQLKQDEIFKITSFLYDSFKELVYNYNLTNETILDDNKINYLNFRKWIDAYFF